MADSYYDKWKAERAKRNQAIQANLEAGVPVENMNISGMNSGLDALYSMITEYKQSDEYKEKLALAEERKGIIKGKMKEGMSRKEARQAYKAEADAYAKEEGFEGNRYRKRNQYLRDKKAEKEAERKVKEADEKNKINEEKGDDKKDDNSANKFRSPLNFGKADATLIAGARRMGQAGRQYNAFAGLDNLINTQMMYKKGLKDRTRKELENVQLEDIDNGFFAFNGGSEACQEYLTECKKELGRLKSEAMRVGVDSPKYAELKSKMTSVENRWKKLNTTMSRLQIQKAEFVEMNGYTVKGDPTSKDDSDGRFRYSQATLQEGNESYRLMQEIMNKDAQMKINPETGKVEFYCTTLDDNGTPIPGQDKVVDLDSLYDNIYERDEDGLSAYTQYRTQVESNQKNNLEFNQGKARSLMNQMFGTNDDPNKKKMVSWMYDDLDGDGKTFLEDYETWADFADVDITQFHSTADWSKPYMEPNENGQMVESGQTVGEYLRDELKEYYIERLRGMHNNLVEANGKSVRSKIGTGEPVNADGEDFPTWHEGTTDTQQTSYEKNLAIQNRDRKKNNETFLAELNSGQDVVQSPNGGFYRKQSDGTYVYYRANGTPMTDADNAPIVYTKEQAEQLGIDKY